MTKWNCQPGWIRWSRKWHKINNDMGSDYFALGMWVTACGEIPGSGKDFEGSDYRRQRPAMLSDCCRWCLKAFYKGE